jgi:hypothetical protein
LYSDSIIYGFEEQIIEHEKSETVEDPAKSSAQFFLNSGMFGYIPPIEKIKSLNATHSLLSGFKLIQK